MNPALLLRAAHILALVCVILFLPLSGISLRMSWRRSRKAFPRIAFLLPCMAVVMALALGLHVMGQFAQTMRNLPVILPELLENDPWLVEIQMVNVLYPPAFMVIDGLAYLLVFALCLIPVRRGSTVSATEQDNCERRG